MALTNAERQARYRARLKVRLDRAERLADARKRRPDEDDVMKALRQLHAATAGRRFDARAWHGDLEPDQRAQAYEWLMGVSQTFSPALFPR